MNELDQKTIVRDVLTREIEQITQFVDLMRNVEVTNAMVISRNFVTQPEPGGKPEQKVVSLPVSEDVADGILVLLLENKTKLNDDLAMVVGDMAELEKE